MLDKFKRVEIASLPTKLEKVERFEKKIGEIDLWIKRDDNTGLALGGNKARKLEFLLADAKDKGCEIVLTTGGAQSNHARMTAAGARKLGMTPILTLKGKKPTTIQGNLLLDKLLDADIRFFDVESYNHIYPEMENIIKEEKYKDKKPYIINLGGSNEIGALGYVNAFIELDKQAEEMGIKIDTIVNSVGSGGTHAGLLAGAKLLGKETEVIGISVSEEKRVFQEDIAKITNDCGKLFGKEWDIDPKEVKILDDYIGDGYGIPSNEGMDAIYLLAQTEGIILDPVYSGKGMAGLMDLTEKGKFKGETVVFFHTGGTPALFDKIKL